MSILAVIDLAGWTEIRAIHSCSVNDRSGSIREDPGLQLAGPVVQKRFLNQIIKFFKFFSIQNPKPMSESKTKSNKTKNKKKGKKVTIN